MLTITKVVSRSPPERQCSENGVAEAIADP